MKQDVKGNFFYHLALVFSLYCTFLSRPFFIPLTFLSIQSFHEFRQLTTGEGITRKQFIHYVAESKESLSATTSILSSQSIEVSTSLFRADSAVGSIHELGNPRNPQSFHTSHQQGNISHTRTINPRNTIETPTYLHRVTTMEYRAFFTRKLQQRPPRPRPPLRRRKCLYIDSREWVVG